MKSIFSRNKKESNSRITLEYDNANISGILLAQEYASLRQESLDSFHTSQSIIQWSLATFGVLFGGVLVALGQASQHIQLVTQGAIFVFMIIIPGLLTAAAWQWLGEITRMERVGVFLRGLEDFLRTTKQAQSLLKIDSPLNWETFLGGGQIYMKRWLTYLGTAAMFFAALACSLLIGWTLVIDMLIGKNWTINQTLLVATSSIIAITFLVVSLYMGFKVISLGHRRYDLVKMTIVSTRN